MHRLSASTLPRLAELNGKLRHTRQQLSYDVHRLRAKHNAMLQQAVAVHEDNVAVRQAVQAMQAEQQELQDHVDNLSAQLDADKARLAAAQREKEALQQSLLSLPGAAAESQAMHERVQADISAMKVQAASTRAAIQRAEGEAMRCEDLRAQHLRSLRSAAQHLTELSRRSTTARAFLQVEKEECETYLKVVHASGTTDVHPGNPETQPSGGGLQDPPVPTPAKRSRIRKPLRYRSPRLVRRITPSSHTGALAERSSVAAPDALFCEEGGTPLPSADLRPELSVEHPAPRAAEEQDCASAASSTSHDSLVVLLASPGGEPAPGSGVGQRSRRGDALRGGAPCKLIVGGAAGSSRVRAGMHGALARQLPVGSASVHEPSFKGGGAMPGGPPGGRQGILGGGPQGASCHTLQVGVKPVLTQFDGPKALGLPLALPGSAIQLHVPCGDEVDCLFV